MYKFIYELQICMLKYLLEVNTYGTLILDILVGFYYDFKEFKAHIKNQASSINDVIV